MDTLEDAREENRRLRRAMRDLVALSTLPAIWIGLRPEGIVRSLADVLFSTLSLDLIYVRLAGLTGEEEVEVARSKHGSDTAHVKAVKASITPILNADRSDLPPTIPEPFNGGTLHVAVTRFGITGDNGVLVAASLRADFPSEHERLLLSVGTNQTATVLQRRRAEEEIKEQRERLRTTLASIGDAVISTDTERRITNMNAVAESLTGWKSVEAIGQPLDTVFRIVNEETRQPVECPARRVLKEGVVVGLANHTLLLSKDGTEHPIDDSAAPIRRKEGEVVGCVLVFRDVTERRRVEKENASRLIASRLLASIVESSEDAIVSKSLDGIIQTWNAAAERVFGYTAEEVVGRHITILIPADRLDEEEHIIGKIRAGKRVEHFDTVRQRKNGEIVPVSLTISPIRDDKGQVVGASKIARNITARIQAETALKQLAADLSDANRRKEDFLATLAHELRGPLAPLRNALAILKVSHDNRQALEETREMMERQLGQMVRLIDDLMDLSRINRGKMELRKERVDLASVVHRAVEATQPMAAASKHELRVTLPPKPIYLNADVVRLTQILTNLLNNSCKYSEPGGKIRLTAERQGSDVVVSVKDTGVGLPPDKLESIFEMFSQVDRTLERSQGGLGIGLALVRRLVEMHGGSITAHSDGVGKGSEFIIRLPIILEVNQLQPVNTLAEEKRTTGKRCILVVDDNRDSANSLAMLLEMTGNETHTAHDGEQAVARTLELRPDVILLDIGMPKLNGYEACRRIREQPWSREVIIIALTGWGQEDDMRKSREAGFNGHLVKPVDYNAMMKLLMDLKPVKA